MKISVIVYLGLVVIISYSCQQFVPVFVESIPVVLLLLQVYKVRSYCSKLCSGWSQSKLSVLSGCKPCVL